MSPWVCEECRAPWEPKGGGCAWCGNRTRVPSGVARARDARYTVEVGTAGGRVHVYPIRGISAPEGGFRLHRYPRTAKGIERAKRGVQRWCNRQNRKIDRAQRLARGAR